MRRILYICTLAFALSHTTSCNKEILDLQPLDQYSSDVVWDGSDPALIESFINNIYHGLGHSFKGSTMMASYVDEAMLVFNYGTSDVNKSLITPSSFNRFDTGNNHSNDFVWENAYRNIRACNLFFDKIENSKAVTPAQKARYMGEVHFLRAYLYHMLVSVYGGVPLITKAYGLNEDYAVPRSSFEDCVKFISEECDKAATLLIMPLQKGRANKGAALALKSRVLLHAASDLYNTGSTWATGYPNKELIGYVGGDRRARYQAAKDAAKAVMDLGLYELYKKDPAPGDNIAKNYGDIFLLKETSEDIFVRFFLSKIGDNNIARYNAPNGFHCYGGNTPVGQLVDDYEMQDGTKFSWANPEHATQPYANREPRFYASILYDGAYLRQRPVDVQASDPSGRVQTGRFERWNPSTNKVDVIPGLDTRQSPIEDWNGTPTGYYLAKFMDPNVNGQFSWQENPWRFIRYTEVLLNYAEACLGLGQEEEARTYINMIRKRAGLPAISASGQALTAAYRHERRIELAYETHRFFDVRRWMIAPQAYTDAQGIDILYKLNPDKTTSTTPVYQVIPSVTKRAWLDRFYFLPIKLDEMNRNNTLIQNPLY